MEACSWHADWMHWRNIGSASSGLAALIATVFAVTYAITKRQGPAWLQAVRDRQRAQAEQAREQAALAREQVDRFATIADAGCRAGPRKVWLRIPLN